MNLALQPASYSSTLSLSIIIPVFKGGDFFRRCLAHVTQFAPPNSEVVVVVDGGTDDSWQIAEDFGIPAVRLRQNGGPARARNVGAAAATGDILFFLDADVAIGADTLNRVVDSFQRHPQFSALIGSYDNAPGAPNFLSQYKNLLHHYTHQTASPEASTFWGACGAIRREVFLEMGGFDESYRQPCIEDIELGYRLKQAGHRILLDRSVQVKHLKRWEPVSLLKADFCYRALPWTELIWRDRQLVNDLNLQTSSRLSVVSVYALTAAVVTAVVWSEAQVVAIGLAVLIAMLLLSINAPIYRFFQQQRNLGFALRVIPWHWLYYGYGGLAFALGTARYWWQHWRQTAPQPMRVSPQSWLERQTELQTGLQTGLQAGLQAKLQTVPTAHRDYVRR